MIYLPEWTGNNSRQIMERYYIGDLHVDFDKYKGIEIYEGKERLCFFNEKGKLALAKSIVENTSKIEDLKTITDGIPRIILKILPGIPEPYKRSWQFILSPILGLGYNRMRIEGQYVHIFLIGMLWIVKTKGPISFR